MVISPRFSVRTPSHTSTHGRRNGACLDEGAACSEEESGAGEGNRTLVVSLGSFLSTIEIHPLCGRHCARGQKRRQASDPVTFIPDRLWRTRARPAGRRMASSSLVLGHVNHRAVLHPV